MYFEGRNLGYVNASEFHSLTALTGLHTLDVSGMFSILYDETVLRLYVVAWSKPFF